MTLNVSYSCASTFQECEYKGCLRYFLKAPKDIDYVEPDYFKIGNAFHKVLEITKHCPNAFSSINFKGIVKDYGLDEIEDGGKIMAMLRVYWAFHSQIPLKVIACEHKFTTTISNGIIDAIMKEDGSSSENYLKGDKDAWWIIDLKTTGKPEEALPSRLHRDPQMCLYAAVAPSFAEKYGLAPEKFAGIRYREVSKPLQRYKAGEEFSSWTTRCQASFREIVVLKEDMSLKESFDCFARVVDRIHEIESQLADTGKILALKNPKACLNFGKSCEYFSVCNNATFTSNLQNSKVIRLENGNLINNMVMKKDVECLIEEFK
jgi:hypothetical protein